MRTKTFDVRTTTRVSTPTVATLVPVSTADLKRWLRVEGDHRDIDIESMRAAAIDTLERDTSRALLTKTITMTLDCLPTADEIELEIFPVQSVTSFSYVDTNGDTQVWGSSNYTLSAHQHPAVIRPAYSVTWPFYREQLDAITIVYVAGATAMRGVPEAAKQCIRHYVEYLFYQDEKAMQAYERRKKLLDWRM